MVEHVLSKRTRQLTVVLEDIFQSHNASAVVRTCECMGIQDVHIVERENEYEVNKYVLKGSYKWVNLIRYKHKQTNTTDSCFKALRAEGYTIYVTDPSAEKTLDEMDVTASKVALVFGNELHGASDYALAHADEKVKIPMYGFTESLNISVSVAFCLATLVPKLRMDFERYALGAEEKDTLRLAWYRKMVKRSNIIEKEFLRTYR